MRGKQLANVSLDYLEKGVGGFSLLSGGVVVRTIMFDIAVAVLVNEEGGGGKKCVLIRKCSLTLTFGFER